MEHQPDLSALDNVTLDEAIIALTTLNFKEPFDDWKLTIERFTLRVCEILEEHIELEARRKDLIYRLYLCTCYGHAVAEAHNGCIDRLRLHLGLLSLKHTELFTDPEAGSSNVDWTPLLDLGRISMRPLHGSGSRVPMFCEMVWLGIIQRYLDRMRRPVVTGSECCWADGEVVSRPTLIEVNDLEYTADFAFRPNHQILRNHFQRLEQPMKCSDCGAISVGQADRRGANHKGKATLSAVHGNTGFRAKQH